MSRPLMTAVAAQQAVIDGLRQTVAVQSQQIAMIARLAGVSPQMDEIAKTAEAENPAQPVPDGPEQPPSETTEQAASPETHDDVRAPGQTGNSVSGVPAAATDVALQPGGTVPAQPYNNLADVTAPVSGVGTGEVGGEQTRIETDVRVGDPMRPEVAFPWTISPNQSNSAPPAEGEMSPGAAGGRSFACLRLARLRIEAGAVKGQDDLTLAASLEADQNLTDTLIEHEIGALSEVVKSAKKSPRGGSGARAKQRPGERVAPSLAPRSATPSTGQAMEDSDIFL